MYTLTDAFDIVENRKYFEMRVLTYKILYFQQKKQGFLGSGDLILNHLYQISV